jgi:hypothetical protein
MERSNSELKLYQDSVTASSNDDEMLAKLPSERNIHRCTEQRERKAFASRSYKSWKYVLPPFPEPSTSCDLPLLSCHLFSSSNSIHLFDIAPFFESREALSRSLACKTTFRQFSSQISHSSWQFSGLKAKLNFFPSVSFTLERRRSENPSSFSRRKF